MGPYDKPFSPQEYLMHYGVKGMKWGVRRYQNKDGTLTKAGKERYSQNQQDGVDSFLMTFSKPLSIPLRSKWEEKSRGKPFSIRFRRPATGPMAI